VAVKPSLTPLALWFRRVYTAMMDPHEERMYLRTLQKTERTNDLLVHALRLLDRNDAAVRRVEQTFATLVQKITQLDRKMENLMSAISDWADAQRAALTELNDSVSAISGSLGDLSGSVAGVASDVDAMKALIEKLQNNPGPISKEDQEVLDQLQAQVRATADSSKAAAESLKAVAAAAKELDDRTPPPAPPPG